MLIRGNSGLAPGQYRLTHGRHRAECVAFTVIDFLGIAN